MITIEAVKCLHGIDDADPCEECIDLLQIEDSREFLERIGMGVVEEVRSMEMIVAGENPSEWDHNKVTEMVRVTEERMFIALAAYDKVKGAD